MEETFVPLSRQVFAFMEAEIEELNQFNGRFFISSRFAAPTWVLLSGVFKF
jgi:hypothetical protein